MLQDRTLNRSVPETLSKVDFWSKNPRNPEVFERKFKGHPATIDVPSEKANISHPKKQLGRWNDPFPFCLGYVILVSLEGICFQLSPESTLWVARYAMSGMPFPRLLASTWCVRLGNPWGFLLEIFNRIFFVGRKPSGKCQQKKGEGCDPVIRFVGPGSSHTFGEVAIFSAIYRGPMSFHLWLDPGPTLSLMSENLKIECEDGFPCSSRMGNDGSWRDGVFQKSSPTSETWLFQIYETFENL